MLALFTVSVIWAVSFPLVKHTLSGVDPDLVNALRLLLAFVVFVPFTAFRRTEWRLAFRLVGIGAVQFGLMYTLYTRAYATLHGYEVATATIMTPLYVALLANWFERRLVWRALGAAVLSILGCAIVLGVARLRAGALVGLFLIQAANLCFALGQLLYRRLELGEPRPSERTVFGWCMLGGALFVTLVAVGRGAWDGVSSLSSEATWALVYLGIVASGLGFFLFNTGARRVSAGVLAVMNDLKIPFGVAASLVLFGEQVELGRLLLGSSVIALGLWLGSGER